MKALVESAGGVASQATLDGHTLTFDQVPPTPGGENRGPSPLDVMALAVGACAHYYAAAFLFARKLPTERLRVEVEFEKVREPVPRIGRLTLRVMLPAGLPEHYATAIERAVRHCPAYGTLLHPPDVELTFEPKAAQVSAPAA
ncbi:MAG TPA: OsmC family protein [Polyangiaceae bacterium]|nr:OsmC family protein [Polyangiaceae bacterium]